MKSPASIKWKRLATEFVAIAGAVYLGLLADNYREYRSERTSEAEYRAQFLQDLDRDIEVLGNLRSEIGDQATAALWIHEAAHGIERSRESVERAFSVLFLTWTYERQRAAYLGLRDGLGLHIVRDFEMRSMLIDYYEIEQSLLLRDFVENYNIAQRRLRPMLDSYVNFVPPTGTDADWSFALEHFHFARLQDDAPSFADDSSFMNAIGEIRARGFELVLEIDDVIRKNRELRQKLEASQD